MKTKNFKKHTTLNRKRSQASFKKGSSSLPAEKNTSKNKKDEQVQAVQESVLELGVQGKSVNIRRLILLMASVQVLEGGR